MKIANIVYEKELINHTKVDYINYYNEPKSFEDIDKTLPTLYVGWSFMKKCNPNSDIINNTDILNYTVIENSLYWTFSFKENKPLHVKGVDKFSVDSPKIYFESNFDYYNIDPVFNQIKTTEDILNLVPTILDNIYIYKNEMMYLLTGNSIIGLDLRMLRFFKLDSDEVIDELDSRLELYQDIIDDSDGELFRPYYKIFPNFIPLKRYLVTILSK